MRATRLVVAATALDAVPAVTTSALAGPAARRAKYKIALSNSYIGNK